MVEDLRKIYGIKSK